MLRFLNCRPAAAKAIDVTKAAIKLIAVVGTMWPSRAIVAKLVRTAIAGTNRPTPLQVIKNIIASSKVVSFISVARSLSRCIQNSFQVDLFLDRERQSRLDVFVKLPAIHALAAAQKDLFRSRLMNRIRLASLGFGRFCKNADGRVGMMLRTYI